MYIQITCTHNTKQEKHKDRGQVWGLSFVCGYTIRQRQPITNSSFSMEPVSCEEQPRRRPLQEDHCRKTIH